MNTKERGYTRQKFLLSLVAAFLLAVCFTVVRPVLAATGINKTINFQGKVVNTDGTNVADGSYSFTFKLYTVSSAGSAVWTESKSLTVTDGIFQTALGDSTTLPGSVDFNTDNIYLGITFNGDPEMSPRVRFSAVPQAFNADQLDGHDAGVAANNVLLLDGSGNINIAGSITTASTLQAGSSTLASLQVTGNATFDTDTLFVDASANRVGIGTVSPGYTLDVNGDINIASGSSFKINGANLNTGGTLTNVAYLDQANTFTQTNTFSNSTYSALFTGGNVGIGTATPTGRLHIAGNISAASWALSGIGLQVAAATYTDTSTAAAGTVASRSANSIAIPTFDSTNAITVTNGTSFYIAGPPAAGANTTITNPTALWVDTGYSRFDDRIAIGPSVKPLAALHIQLAVSEAAWGANGVGIRLGTANYTDTTSSGTVVNAVTNSITPGIYNASSATTYTNTANLYLSGAPTAGTNVTITNPWALWVDSGQVRIDDGLVIGRTTNQSAMLTVGQTFSAPAWGINGIRINTVNTSITDNSSSGTVTNAVGDAHQIITFAASSATTYTNAATLYVGGAPAASTNVTITNPYAFWVDAGDTRFDGRVSISPTVTALGAQLQVGGTTSSTAWGTTGVVYRGLTGTYTDTSSSGTVAAAVMNSFVNATIAASSATTFTDSATLYVAAAPTAGTNVTLTNPYAFWVDSGTARFDGNIGVGISSPSAPLHVAGNIRAETSATGEGFHLYSGSTFIGGFVRTTVNSAVVPTLRGVAGRPTTISNLDAGAVLMQVTNSAGTVLDVIDDSGRLGINTTGPDRRIDVLDASNPQLRLTQTDGSVYADLQADSSGNLIVLPTGSTMQLGNTTTNRVLSINNGTSGGTTATLDLGTRSRNWNMVADVAATSYGLHFDYVGTDVPFSNVISLGRNGMLGVGVSTPAAILDLATSLSASAWGNNGIGLRVRSSTTYTDTSSSGAVSSAVVSSFGTATLAASSSTTYGTGATVYIQNAPSAGTNVTISNPLALWVDNGDVRFDGKMQLGSISTSPGAVLMMGGNYSRQAWGIAGAMFRVDNGPWTLTDTTSSGTVANVAINGLAAVGIAASNVTTYTDAANLYIASGPTAGTNVTLTNKYGLWVDADDVRFDGKLSVGVGIAPVGVLDIGGTQTASAWGTSGLNLRVRTNTLTDTSSSGTVATNVANSLGRPTLTASSATTFTDAANLYILDAPTAGSNVTVTNSYALWVDGGNTRLDGKLSVGSGASPTAIAQIGGNNSGAFWGVNAMGLRVDAGTYTDTTSSGTTTTQTGNSIAAPIFAASSTTTYTRAINFYIAGPPTAGTNVTLTNPWALFVGSGQSGFAGRVGIGGGIVSNNNPVAWLDIDTTSTNLPYGFSAVGNVLRVGASRTLTDITSSGTVASAHIAHFDQFSLASSNAVTLTDTATVHIAGAPIAGTNTTFTRKYGLWVDADDTRLDGNLSVATNAAPAANFDVGGNMSSAAWGNNGILFRGRAATFTDTSSSGTVGTVTAGYGLNNVTFAASNATTYTTAATLYINAAPIAGSNVSITNALAMYVNGGNIAMGSSVNIGMGTASPGAVLHITSAKSAPAWTTSGIGLRIDSTSYTDTTSSGTVTLAVAHAIGTPTFAASSTTTYTTAATLQIANPPIAGTNVTITNPLTLYVANGNASIGTGSLGIGTVAPSARVHVVSSNSGATPSVLRGMQVSLDNAETVGSTSNEVTGFYNIVRMTGGNTQNNTGSIGLTPYIADVRTVAGATGTITNTHGLYVITLANAGNTVLSNVYGVRVAPATNTGSGSITRATGLALADQNVATNNTNLLVGTNSIPNGNYSIYNSSNNPNYFSGSLGIGTTSINSKLQIAGNLLTTAWGVSGIGLRIDAGTFTDSSSSGTVAQNAVNAIAASTLAASSSTTYTDAATLYIGAQPTAGTNVTLSNSWALWIDNGNARFDGSITVGGTITVGTMTSTGALAITSAASGDITIYPNGAGSVKIGSASNNLSIDANGKLTRNGTASTNSGIDHFQDVQIAGISTVRSGITCDGTLQAITTSITNPDVPRTVSITESGAGTPTGGATVTGTLADGTTGATEVINFTDGGTAAGSKAFATVTQISIPTTCPTGSTVTVGTTDKLGLSNSIHGQNTVYKVKKNTADITIPTVDTTNSTVDLSTITVNDDVSIWYKY